MTTFSTYDLICFLFQYTTKVEQLENELKLYKEGRYTNLNNSHDGIESNNLINEENRRLKAENNVLQKKLSGTQQKKIK